MTSTGPALLEALEGLGRALGGATLTLEVPGVGESRRLRDEIVGQLDDYLLPRARALDAPLLTVVGGSTGAGKSTLVNSLVGEDISKAGVLRPTTRAPVLVCHPDDQDSFASARILPGLRRFTSTGGTVSAVDDLHLVVTSQVPAGLALLDAPDIDSVVEANRDLAALLLAAADLWLFVTTAARYADAVPWGYLRAARDRSTALALVLNRVPPEAAEVASHLASMLDAGGLAGVPVFVVPEAPLDEQRLPASSVQPVRTWLHGLAADADARAAVVRATLDGALDSLEPRIGDVVEGVERQQAAARELGGEVERAYRSASQSVDEGVGSGTLLRGEVLARWQEFIGTGDFMRGLEQRVGQVRDRIRATVTGRPVVPTEVKVALASSIEALVVAASDRACEQVSAAWRVTSAGTGALGADRTALERSSPTLAQSLQEEVRAWQGRVLELVKAKGASRRTAARGVSYAVNATGVALMVAIFSQTGGLSGGEVVVAGGTATVSQKLLEAMFGDQAVRLLAAEARTDLMVRIDALLAAEAQRFTDRLSEATPDAATPERLRDALADVRAARA